MSSNRASAQRSRQRKQDRLDELEVLTARLRLENATILQKLNLATKLAKKFEGEKKEFQNRCEELSKEVEKMRELYSPASTSQNSTNKRGNMFPTKLEPSDGLDVKLKNSYGQSIPIISPKPSLESLDFSQVTQEQAHSETDPQALFHQLCLQFESEMLDLNVDTNVSDVLEEEWLTSFAECLKS